MQGPGPKPRTVLCAGQVLIKFPLTSLPWRTAALQGQAASYQAAGSSVQGTPPTCPQFPLHSSTLSTSQMRKRVPHIFPRSARKYGVSWKDALDPRPSHTCYGMATLPSLHLNPALPCPGLNSGPQYITQPSCNYEAFSSTFLPKGTVHFYCIGCPATAGPSFLGTIHDGWVPPTVEASPVPLSCSLEAKHCNHRSLGTLWGDPEARGQLV